MKPLETKQRLIDSPELHRRVREFVLRGFQPRFDRLGETFPTRPHWRRIREMGTHLWIDSGDPEAAGDVWTREFSALTTNNTLLNAEIQKGVYDDLTAETAELLAEFPDLTDAERLLEAAFILNAWHGLRLVEQFDAFIFVEEHTDLAHDVDLAVAYARRYFDLCPQRFIVKIPFTPAGLLAARRLSRQGIPVNLTLGFSARQNYIAARLADPLYVNVFLGRLNSFIASNHLGDGRNVGEKAALASQAAVDQLRLKRLCGTRQIAASLRDAPQVGALAGMDVLTIPPKIARDFIQLDLSPEQIHDQRSHDYPVGVSTEIDFNRIGLNSLWHVDETLTDAVDDLMNEGLDAFTPRQLTQFFHGRALGDVLPDWTQDDTARSREEGKIPRIDNWSGALKSGAVGLDSLMNLAGLSSFAVDQRNMDNRIQQLWGRSSTGGRDVQP